MVWMKNVTREATQMMDLSTGKMHLIRAGEIKLMPDWFKNKFQGTLQFIKEDNETTSEDLFEEVTKNVEVLQTSLPKVTLAPVPGPRIPIVQPVVAPTVSKAPKTYSINNLLEELKITRPTYCLWVKKGKITPNKNDRGRIYFTQEQVDAIKKERGK